MRKETLPFPTRENKRASEERVINSFMVAIRPDNSDTNYSDPCSKPYDIYVFNPKYRNQNPIIRQIAVIRPLIVCEDEEGMNFESFEI